MWGCAGLSHLNFSVQAAEANKDLPVDSLIFQIDQNLPFLLPPPPHPQKNPWLSWLRGLTTLSPLAGRTFDEGDYICVWNKRLIVAFVDATVAYLAGRHSTTIHFSISCHCERPESSQGLGQTRERSHVWGRCTALTEGNVLVSTFLFLLR